MSSQNLLQHIVDEIEETTIKRRKIENNSYFSFLNQSFHSKRVKTNDLRHPHKRLTYFFLSFFQINSLLDTHIFTWKQTNDGQTRR